jgi:hypothetical protein
MLVWNELSNSWQGNQPDSIRRMITHSAIRSSIRRWRSSRPRPNTSRLAARSNATCSPTTAARPGSMPRSPSASRARSSRPSHRGRRNLAATPGCARSSKPACTYSATEDLHQVHLEPGAALDEEQVEADQLLETISALEAEERDARRGRRSGCRRLPGTLGRRNSAYDALHDKPPVIPDEMKANVGCFVIIGADGSPVIAAASTATSRSNGARPAGPTRARARRSRGGRWRRSGPSRCRRSWSRNWRYSAATFSRSTSLRTRRSRSTTDLRDRRCARSTARRRMARRSARRRPRSTSPTTRKARRTR